MNKKSAEKKHNRKIQSWKIFEPMPLTCNSAKPYVGCQVRFRGLFISVGNLIAIKSNEFHFDLQMINY